MGSLDHKITEGDYLTVDAFDELVHLVGDAWHHAVCVAAANGDSGRGRQYARQAFIESSSPPPELEQNGKGKELRVASVSKPAGPAWPFNCA
jgi:hypothetical protein